MDWIITTGSGIAWLHVWHSSGGNEGEALDNLIDNIVATCPGVVMAENDAITQRFTPDQYIIGGNNGLALVHHGALNIQRSDHYDNKSCAPA